MDETFHWYLSKSYSLLHDKTYILGHTHIWLLQWPNNIFRKHNYISENIIFPEMFCGVKCNLFKHVIF